MNILKEIQDYDPYLRFELGLENLKDEEYRHESLRRASDVYRSIFNSEDDVLFIHRSSCGKDEVHVNHIRLKRFFKTKVKKMRLCILPYEYDESDDDLNTKESTVEVKAKEIRMPYVLECIVNSDFMRKPMPGGRIYLYNKTKDIMFNMYDDRGCDILSSDKETLLPFYHCYRNWILDYNRYEIDCLFAEGLAGIVETEQERKIRWEFDEKKVADSGINLKRDNTCHISHHFEIPTVNASMFVKEIAYTSFEIQRIAMTNDKVTYKVTKTEALALIDYQTHLMSMYGKKYGIYTGWSFVRSTGNEPN
ncbi:DUF3885 domain-containing protein [Neobacillus mesonae]|nr:DUF3885 domain-containing protein [Neobacillus mesonae]